MVGATARVAITLSCQRTPKSLSSKGSDSIGVGLMVLIIITLLPDGHQAPADETLVARYRVVA